MTVRVPSERYFEHPATDAGGSIESWRGRTRLGTFFDSIVAMAALLRM